MQLNTIKSHSKRVTSMRVGRGGKRGKTSGRGGKGQTARAGHKIRPEIRDMIKKLPKRRGHGKNRSRTVRIDRVSHAPVNLAALEAAFTASKTSPPEKNVQIIDGDGIVKFAGTVGIGNFSMSAPDNGPATYSFDMSNIGAPTTDDLGATA